MTDAQVISHVIDQFPSPCHRHPLGVRIDRDSLGTMVYCEDCYLVDPLESRMGCGDGEREAIREWNELEDK